MIFKQYLKLALLFLLLLPACSGLTSGNQPPVSFIPPSLPPDITPQILVNRTPTPTKLSIEVRPSPTLDCTDILSFMDDLTIPDGTVVKPNEAIDKRWQLANSGTCNWDNRYKIVMVSGPTMGGEAEQDLFPARSGTQFILRMKLTAPNEPGVYRSAWQASGPQGKNFGDLFFIEIVVEP